MPDSDLEMEGRRGGGGVGHPDPYKTGGGAVSKKSFFGPSGLSLRKNTGRGGGGGGLPEPLP